MRQCVAICFAVALAVGTVLAAKDVPTPPGTFSNLYGVADSINVAEGAVAECTFILNSDVNRGGKNCSNPHGYYAVWVDGPNNTVAYLYAVDGVTVCDVFNAPNVTAGPYELWPATQLTYIREGRLMGLPTYEFRATYGRFALPLITYQVNNNPAMFAEGIATNIHTMWSMFLTDVVANDDSRLMLPAECSNPATRRELPLHEAVRVHESLFDGFLTRLPPSAVVDSAPGLAVAVKRSRERVHKLGFGEVTELTEALQHGLVPDAVDNAMYATAVRDQGRCGGCWAFSSAAVTEVVMNKRRGARSNRTAAEWLSPQSLLDCVHGDMNGTAIISAKGCWGGWPLTALTNIVEHGIATEETYRYAFVTGSRCHRGDAGVVVVKPVSSAFMLPASNVSLMKAAISAYGAVTAIIAAPHDWAFHSTDGVYDNPACRPGLDHAITLVGYGTDADTGKDYWLVKNSFGAGWGDAGYVRMARGVNMCGIEDFPAGVRPV
jgi:hypothetical protein